MYQGKVTGRFQFKAPSKTDIKLPPPNGFLMLVRMLEVNNKTKGGIELDSISKAAASEEFTIGYVEKKGSLCYKHEKFEGQVYCNEGDYVMFSRFSGLDFEFQGHRLKLLVDDKPVMTFTEQQLLDFGILVKDEDNGNN